MRLERHIGGLSLQRKLDYLRGAGWLEARGQWRGPLPEAEPVPLPRALHHQLTADLSARLVAWGWSVAGYTPRGYAQLQDPLDGRRCALPAALRRQARRLGTPVADFTYSLFLAVLLQRDPPPAPVSPRARREC